MQRPRGFMSHLSVHDEIHFEILPAWLTKWRLTRFSMVPVSRRSKIISDYRDVSPESRFCRGCKRVCLTFVFLYALSSAMKRRKSGKTREKTACLPSFWVHHSLRHDFTPMENLSFSMTRHSTTHIFLFDRGMIIFNISFNRNYISRTLALSTKIAYF